MDETTRIEFDHQTGHLIACDGQGEDLNRYETLLSSDLLHIAFNKKDCELFVAVLSYTLDEHGGADLDEDIEWGCHAMSARELRNLGWKLLSLGCKVDPTGGLV